MATTPGSSTYRSVSKSLPATPKHRSSGRVEFQTEFQTEFPEHCQIFDGHMKVRQHTTTTAAFSFQRKRFGENFCGLKRMYFILN